MEGNSLAAAVEILGLDGGGDVEGCAFEGGLFGLGFGFRLSPPLQGGECAPVISVVHNLAASRGPS